MLRFLRSIERALLKVETYSEKYFSDVVRLIEKFHAKYLTDYYGSPSKDVITETIINFKDLTFLLLDRDKCVGVLAGVEIKSKLNDERFFQEIIWYVEKPYGRFGFYLIKKVKIMLKSLWFSHIIMSVLESMKSKRIEAIYNKLGFKPMETHYVRTL